MIKMLRRGVRERHRSTRSPVGCMPSQTGARMFWTLTAGQEELVGQLSAPRRLGVIGLIGLTLLAAPVFWASLALVDTPLAPVPVAKADEDDDKDDQDDEEDSSDTHNPSGDSVTHNPSGDSLTHNPSGDSVTHNPSAVT